MRWRVLTGAGSVDLEGRGGAVLAEVLVVVAAEVRIRLGARGLAARAARRLAWGQQVRFVSVKGEQSTHQVLNFGVKQGLAFCSFCSE